MIFRAIKLFAKISDDAEPVLELQKAELKSKARQTAFTQMMEIALSIA